MQCSHMKKLMLLKQPGWLLYFIFSYWNLKIPDWLLGFIPTPSAMRKANFLQHIIHALLKSSEDKPCSKEN